MKDRMKYLITGALSGIVNGFFGSGGGLILVPAFTYILKLEEKTAFATSVAVILPISILSVFLYGVDFSSSLPYIIGGVAGGLIGGKIFKKVPTIWLHRIFGVFILYGGVKAVIGF